MEATMKKVFNFAFMLALLLVFCLFLGCGGKKTPDNYGVYFKYQGELKPVQWFDFRYGFYIASGERANTVYPKAEITPQPLEGLNSIIVYGTQFGDPSKSNKAFWIQEVFGSDKWILGPRAITFSVKRLQEELWELTLSDTLEAGTRYFLLTDQPGEWQSGAFFTLAQKTQVPAH